MFKVQVLIIKSCKLYINSPPYPLSSIANNGMFNWVEIILSNSLLDRKIIPNVDKVRRHAF